MRKVAIIIPAFNEAQVIGDVIKLLPKSLTLSNKKYEVINIIVNDGSKDKTGDIVKQFKDVHLIEHIQNSGAGAATRTGMHYALALGCDYALTMDADGQHDIEDGIHLLEEISKDKADFINGSRLLDDTGMPRHRVIGNKGLSFITFLIFGVFLTDSQSGIKAFNRTALEKIDFHSDHYAFCSEMIWQAKRVGLTIVEIPVRAIYTDYSIQKGQTNWNSIQIIGQLVKRRVMELING